MSGNGKTDAPNHQDDWDKPPVRDREEPRPNGHDATPRLWEISQLSKWAGVPITPRPWFMEDWIIRGQCTGLYGIGGVRKTDFLLQAMIAGALGKAFCGIPLAPCATLGLFCEDTGEEIARRAERIAAFYGARLADLEACHYASLVGVQLTELIAFDYGRPMPTDAFHLFWTQLEQYRPSLAVLDTAPDFFGGSEIDRRQVAQFIRLLDSAGHQFDCAIVFSAQPSVRGRASRLFDSGSTGWENKVRARLSLHDPETQTDDEEPRPKKPSDRRILTRVKSNYAEPGEEIALVLRDGGFLPEAIDAVTAPLRGPARELACRSKFLELLDAVGNAGRWVNDSRTNASRYAPKVMASHPKASTFSEKDLAKAMKYLLDTEAIRLGTFRHAGKNYPALVRSQTQGDANDA